MAATVEALLAASGLPRAEALVLLAHATGLARTRLVAGAADRVDDRLASAFGDLAARRRDGAPIAYLVGYREFYGRPFVVDARVLIPRPETELLVDRVLERIDAGARRVLDLGTGSGAIAISVALERPQAIVTATDASDDALAVARDNAQRLGARVSFARGDWYGALAANARFDVVVANPPYVAAGDPHLAAGDLRFEPPGALTDGGDGLGALRAVVGGAAAFLADGGALVVEHGFDQAEHVRALFETAGFATIAQARDLAGVVRVTAGSLPCSVVRPRL